MPPPSCKVSITELIDHLTNDPARTVYQASEYILQLYITHYHRLFAVEIATVRMATFQQEEQLREGLAKSAVHL
jgi:hypothetical protein